MEKQPDFTSGLPMEKIMQLANSPHGQALLNQLQQTHPDTLESAIQDAKSGNYEQVKKTMSEFLSSPSGQAFMQQLRGYGNG